MKTMEMNQQEQDDLFAIVASVLHMGNVGFTEEDGIAQILKPGSVEAVATVRSFVGISWCNCKAIIKCIRYLSSFLIICQEEWNMERDSILL